MSVRRIMRPLLHDDAELLRELHEALEDLGVRPGQPFVIGDLSLDGDGGARRRDPATSKASAKAVAPNARNQRGVALRHIIASSDHGMTAAELVTRTGINGLWKRVSELEQGGYIVFAERTRWNAQTGRDNQVYVATEKGRQAL